MNPQIMDPQALEHLNALLKGEMSAVESYGKVLPSIEDRNAVEVLRECRESHAERAEKLRSAISALGGTPEPTSGPWGSLAKMVSAAASGLGGNVALQALEEGEDIGSNDYEWRLVNMHGDYRKLIKDDLYPQQQDTHRKLSSLIKSSTKGVWPPNPPDKEV